MENGPECRICRTEASIGKNSKKQVVLSSELSYDEIYCLLDLFLRNTFVIQWIKNYFPMFSYQLCPKSLYVIIFRPSAILSLHLHWFNKVYSSRMFNAMDEIQQKRILRALWSQVQLYANLFARHASSPAP